MMKQKPISYVMLNRDTKTLLAQVAKKYRRKQGQMIHVALEAYEQMMKQQQEIQDMVKVSG